MILRTAASVSSRLDTARLPCATSGPFWSTITDKAFLDEAKKSGRDINGQANAKDVEGMVADIYATPPDLVKKAAEVVK